MPNHDRWNDGEFALSDHLSHYRKNRSINLRGQSKHYWKWKFREREREREREITWFVGEPKNQTKNTLIYFSLSLSLSLKPTHNPYLTKKKKNHTKQVKWQNHLLSITTVRSQIVVKTQKNWVISLIQ